MINDTMRAAELKHDLTGKILTEVMSCNSGLMFFFHEATNI